MHDKSRNMKDNAGKGRNNAGNMQERQEKA